MFIPGNQLGLLSLLFALLPVSSATQLPLRTALDPKRVAVIGAGAGGSFAAYELHKLAEEAGIPVNITVFERTSHVGGRSTTVNAFDDPAYPIELGASIFVKVNQNLVNASRDLGLLVQSADHAQPKEAEESIGIWDGTQFVFSMKNSDSWWNIGRIFWRYGLAPLRTQNLMKSTVGKFLRLYEEPLFPFESLSEAVHDIGLVDATSAPGQTFLDTHKISEVFAREIIQASTRVNYGQNLGLIHGLESMVCMAAEGAVSIDGGNWRIFDGILKTSNAQVNLNTTVTEIARNDDGTSRINFKPTEFHWTQSKHVDFDEVIIAGPFQYSGISVSPPLQHVPDEVPYVKLHVTLLASPHRISPGFFSLQGEDARAPETILTTLPPGLDLGSDAHGVGPAGFWSISTLRTVTRSVIRDGEEKKEQHYVYKIFSPERPTAEFVAQVFGIDYSDDTGPASTIGDLPKSHISWFYEKIWHPYPLMYPRVTFEKTLLAPGLWYTGGIESFISTMETSALMGRNVAALMVKSWKGRTGQKEEVDLSGKTEL